MHISESQRNKSKGPAERGYLEGLKNCKKTVHLERSEQGEWHMMSSER